MRLTDRPNNRNGNIRLDEQDFNRLQMLPIDDKNTLLEFDQNLTDPAHRQMRAQFVII